MTLPDYSTAPPDSGGGTASAATDRATDRGREVAQQAQSAAGDVAQNAKDRARDVAGEAKAQASTLADQTRSTLSSYATDQTGRLGQVLEQLAEELHSMADNGKQGTASSLVREAAERVDEVARHVGGRDVGDLLDDVRAFARRRPGAFLAGAAGLGLLVGRLGRGLRDAPDTGSGGTTGYRSATATTATTGTWAEPYPTELTAETVTTGYGSTETAPAVTSFPTAPEPAGLPSTGYAGETAYSGGASYGEPATDAGFDGTQTLPGTVSGGDDRLEGGSGYGA